ncbi:MAG: hypothetical protein PVG39_04660 [Desulfobacteraceae bacterium]|jgi:hypothetical protein
MNIKSSTGCVHKKYSGSREYGFMTLCRHVNTTYGVDGYEHRWPETNEPITCKRCLNLMRRKKFDANGFRWVVVKDMCLTARRAGRSVNIVGMPDQSQMALVRSGHAKLKAKIAVSRAGAGL